MASAVLTGTEIGERDLKRAKPFEIGKRFLKAAKLPPQSLLFISESANLPKQRHFAHLAEPRPDDVPVNQ